MNCTWICYFSFRAALYFTTGDKIIFNMLQILNNEGILWLLQLPFPFLVVYIGTPQRSVSQQCIGEKENMLCNFNVAPPDITTDYL